MFPATDRFKHLHYSVPGYVGVLLRSNGTFYLILKTINDYTDNSHNLNLVSLDERILNFVDISTLVTSACRFGLCLF